MLLEAWMVRKMGKNYVDYQKEHNYLYIGLGGENQEQGQASLSDSLRLGTKEDEVGVWLENMGKDTTDVASFLSHENGLKLILGMILQFWKTTAGTKMLNE